MNPPELLVVALEASADLHGASVLRELKALRPDLRAFGAGGPRMRAEGFEALVRAEEISVMGVAEVIPALPRILEAMDALRDAARERRPRAALLIDSPDFNLRLARRLRELKIPVAYFIGPSVWAWRTYRVRQIARDIARMLVILPFERRFYETHGVPATYVGNPLADGLRGGVDLPARALSGTLALLPGSRVQEVARIWPAMLRAARMLRERHPELRLVVPVAPTIDHRLLGDPLDVELVDGKAPDVLARADAAIVASGTATLEAALALTPLVVVYRTSWLTWLIGRLLVRLRFVSLVNLLAGRAIVPELLQADCTPGRIAAAAEPLLSATPERTAQLGALRAVRAELLPEGSSRAARRAAEEVLALVEGP
ncbi:MAG TPA: lipid-A-disaccharide synthase [Myxococcales bacterium]|nr:lipid-A-disaccharide synthase [Myxococcales bacterium]